MQPLLPACVGIVVEGNAVEQVLKRNLERAQENRENYRGDFKFDVEIV